jgi:GT2 family glycosyltransferase
MRHGREPPTVSIVIATRDRRRSLLRSLERLAVLPDRTEVIVIDNGSSDGSVRAVRERFPAVRTVELGRNHGAVARNHGVALADAPYVAFADDDSWWEPGSLTLAAQLFDAHPRLGLLQARILVGPADRLDPVCAAMAASPLPAHDAPGTPILGFVACGAMVRRRAFLDMGGFDDLLFFFGEETVLAQDLAAAGWQLAYVPDVVAHHAPDADAGDRRGRRQRRMRNEVLSAVMRRPRGVACAQIGELLADATRDPSARAASRELVGLVRPALRRRRPLPDAVESSVRLLEANEQR